MKKVLFIAVSDVHWHDWSNQFNKVDRLLTVRDTMAKIYKVAHDKDAAILLPGDLVHNPEHISNRTLQELLAFYKQNDDIITYAIDGNHDQSDQNSLEHRSPNYVTTIASVIPNFVNVADKSVIADGGVLIQGIPYLTSNKGFAESLKKLALEHTNLDKRRSKILLIHTDLPRAKDSSGYQIDTVSNIPANLGKLFKPWDLVLSGHIHMGQKMTSKVIMVGAPYQQRRSDKNLTPGYWEIYNDMSYKFIPIDGAPTYKDGKPKDDFNFYTKKVKAKKQQKDGKDLNFDKSLSTGQLVDNYLEATGEKSKKRKRLLKEFLK